MGFGWRQSKGNCENIERELGCNPEVTKPEGMERDTEEMQHVLKHGAREEREGSSFSLPVRTRCDEFKLRFMRG